MSDLKMAKHALRVYSPNIAATQHIRLAATPPVATALLLLQLTVLL